MDQLAGFQVALLPSLNARSSALLVSSVRANLDSICLPDIPIVPRRLSSFPSNSRCGTFHTGKSKTVQQRTTALRASFLDAGAFRQTHASLR